MMNARRMNSDLKVKVYTDMYRFSGRVEVCLDGTVCDDGWDMRDATTVCRQLGLSGICTNYYTHNSLASRDKIIIYNSESSIGYIAPRLQCV